MRGLAILISAALIHVACSSSRTGSLEVHVIDADSLYGLSKTMIFFDKQSPLDSAHNVLDGLSHVEGLEERLDTIYIVKYGYHTMELPIEIRASTKTIVEAQLKSYTLDKKLVKWVCGPPSAAPADYVRTHTRISYVSQNKIN